MELQNQEINELVKAKKLLEADDFSSKITSLLSEPVDTILKSLPKKWVAGINISSEKAIKEAFKFSIKTIAPNKHHASSDRSHILSVMATGAAGGVFGLPGFIIEVPISTLIIMRSIADIAGSHGEDLSSPEARLACVEVLSIGGNRNNGMDYISSRLGSSIIITQAATYMAANTIPDETAPVLTQFIARVASRFSAMVTEMAFTYFVPLVGSITGTFVNLLFIEHFQNMAHGHFIVRSLERKYGQELIFKIYQDMKI